MSTPDQGTTTSGWSRPFQLLAQIVGVIAALAGIAIPLLLYVVGSQRTLLTLNYLAKQALVNITPTNTTPITVTYSNVLVKSPWLLSGRIVNNGTTPIVQTDVVDLLTLTFRHAKILNVSMPDTEKHPTQIATTQRISKTYTDADTVTLGFDLLNPDDYLTFNIFLDGDPGDYPKDYWASFRMKGKFSFIETQISQRPDRPFITFPSLTKLWQSISLMFTSIGTVIVLLAGISLSIEGIRDIRKFRVAVTVARMNIQDINISDDDTGAKKRQIYNLLRPPLKYEFYSSAYNDDVTAKEFFTKLKLRVNTAKIRIGDFLEAAMGVLMLGVTAAAFVVVLGAWMNFFIYQT